MALYRWADGVDDQHIDRLGEALDELASRVPGVRRVTHGRDAGLAGGSFDYVVVVDVDTVAGWRALRDHPSYILLVEELLTGHVAAEATGEFRLDEPSVIESTAAEPDLRSLSDDELMERARRAAQASMDALLAEPDDLV